MMLALFGLEHASVAVTVWFWITLVLALVWMKRHIDLNAGQKEPSLGPNQPGPALGELPSVSFLIAGKDEEANIGRCLESLLTQDYPKLQIIVIDDRSTDRTPQIIDEIAARDPRVTALHVEHLPDGWFGKNHAMHVGVQQATGEWLCFSDADCTYESPRLVSAAVRYALQEKADLLSVLPRLETNTLWERIVQPAAGGIMLYWYPPKHVNSPKYAAAYANGAFMLMSRETYDTLGGHEPVKATLNEDMHLARRTKQAGLRLRVIRGGDLYRVRMYTGLGQIWRGWSRIFYGCFGTFGKLFASVLMLSIASLSPLVALLVAPFVAGGAALATAAAATLLVQQTVLWRFYALTGNGAPWALTYHLGAAICLGMTLNAMRRLGGTTTTTWRGTTYRRGA